MTQQLTGKIRVWTTSPWRDIVHIRELIKDGHIDEAVGALTYSNCDMSDSEGWTEVGIAEVSVTLHPHDTVVAKELDSLKAQLERVRAENHLRENAILDRISNLQAITYTPAEAA